MRKILFTLSWLILVLSITRCSFFKPNTVTIKVKPAEYITEDLPVFAGIQIPDNFKGIEAENIGITLKSGSVDEPQSGQLIKCADGEYKICWILPETNQNKSTKWKAEFHKPDESAETGFKWADTPDKYLDLYLDGKKVFRYCYELDDHFKKGETLTAKNRVFYHIYDLEGKEFITNGPEEGVWPHHRGIMIGWRDLGYKGQKLSFWGMEDLTVQKHIKFIETSAGSVSGKVVSEIHWNDSTGNTLLKEKRTAVIYRQSPPDIMILDFTSMLTAVNGAVKLDGNAEHGGVQFRAHNDVAEGVDGSKKPTYYFNKDGIDPYKDFNLPWVSMEYGLRNKTYSILDIDHPKNPKPSIWSAYRDYGRFGPFFVYELNDNETLEINYRFWISESSMPSREILHAISEAYVNPPEMEVLTR